ncbi:MAG: hypothetical protein JWQ69_1559, partial [Pseudomonas sp.]|nr:hypothetical protein [Pseudomonas sp.]
SALARDGGVSGAEDTEAKGLIAGKRAPTDVLPNKKPTNRWVFNTAPNQNIRVSGTSPVAGLL